MSRYHKFIWLPLGFLLAVLAAVVVCAYLGFSSGFTIFVFRYSFLPIAKSGDKLIFFNDLEKFSGHTVVNLQDAEEELLTYHKVYSAYILAEKLGVKKQRCDVLGLDPEICLQFAWISNPQTNRLGFDLVKEALRKLSEGQEFGSLAAAVSQDIATSTFFGDSGFIDLSETLPEFKGQVMEIPLRDPKIVASRHGLHIVLVDEIIQDSELGRPRYHIFEIFFKPQDGFETWELAQISERKLKNFLP